MTNKERMLAALNGQPTDRMPVTPHWWGLYKFADAGLISDGYEDADKAWSMSGQELADVDSAFYQKYNPGWFHLTTGAACKNKAVYFSDQAKDDAVRLFEAVKNLESYAVLDEYIDFISRTPEEILESGEFDHIRILSERWGNESLLMLNEGNPISNILDPHGCVGFVEGLMALIEEPDKMEYLIRGCYRALIPRMEALKQAGGSGFIGSETYCSADIMSPDLWRNIIYPAQKEFYHKVREMGLISVSYFLGDIMPLLPDLCEMGIHGLLVEEGKKNFALDIGEIYDRIEQRVCLFGNLDSVYTLQMGTPEAVEAETLHQIHRCNKGSFVMANGCPISFGTPAENIHRMIETCFNY